MDGIRGGGRRTAEGHGGESGWEAGGWRGAEVGEAMMRERIG
jgi:hypothetical protein